MKFFGKKKAPRSDAGQIALCLGGGGARGYAHIGALRAFEENGIDFKLCVGTSVGAIVGALYAAGVKAAEMEEIGDALDLKDIRSGFILTPDDPLKIGRIVTNILGDADIGDFPKRFAAVAVDLVEGKQVILDSGRAGLACSASACVPMFFRPVIDGDRHLVDGGLLNNIPADVCRMLGAKKVVSVDINPTRGGGTAELGLIDVLKATFSIMGANASINGIRQSDVLIAPDLSRFRATRKDGHDEMIEIGYNAALEHIDEIKALFADSAGKGAGK
ncbi:MAG: patatin-like phospholipase family protein [Clostridiales bacterium]|jgi:NTE family protein|nr:patatin-like phospholipase family protein [Clostridiales bacterium]